MADAPSGSDPGHPAIPGTELARTDHALDAELVDRAIARPAVPQRRNRQLRRAEDQAESRTEGRNRQLRRAEDQAEGRTEGRYRQLRRAEGRSGGQDWIEAHAPSFSPSEVVSGGSAEPEGPPPWPQRPEVDENGVPVLRSIDDPPGGQIDQERVAWGWRETWSQRPPSEWELDPGAVTSPTDLHAQPPTSHLHEAHGNFVELHWPAPPELGDVQYRSPAPPELQPPADPVQQSQPMDLPPPAEAHGITRRPVVQVPTGRSPQPPAAVPRPDSEPTQGTPAITVGWPSGAEAALPAPPAISPEAPDPTRRHADQAFLPALSAPADEAAPPTSRVPSEPIEDLLPPREPGLGPLEDAWPPPAPEAPPNAAPAARPAGPGWDQLIDPSPTGQGDAAPPSSPGFGDQTVKTRPAGVGVPTTAFAGAAPASIAPSPGASSTADELDWHNGRGPREGTLLGTVGAWVGLFALALVFAFAVRTFVGQAYKIPSGSMLPTLEISDRVIVNKLSYSFGEPQRGDLVVFERPEGTDGPEEALIKRVLALPGETVLIQDGEVYVDRRRVGEDYLRRPSSSFALRGDAIPNCPGATATECLVPEGTVFVMGDHRGDSTDSRAFGPVDDDQIVGRAFYRMWPMGRLGRI